MGFAALGGHRGDAAFGTCSPESSGPHTRPLLFSLFIVWLTTLVLLRDVKVGSVFQDTSTILKIACPHPGHHCRPAFLGEDFAADLLPAGERRRCVDHERAFAISLYYVMYAYSGWNASTYIVGEVHNPGRAIPLSVGLGTFFVMGLYLAVNAVFLHSTPIPEMVGKQQVALVAGRHLFGDAGAKVMALFICFGLISTVSSMMWIGPRVTMAMGEDLRALGWLARKNARGIPVTAILAQFVIVNVLLLTSTFEKVINYVQFALTLSSALAVAGVIVLRWKMPNLPRPYRAWGYPVTPLIFIAISVWMLWHMLADASTRGPSLLGLATIASGLVVYYLSPKNPAPSPAAPTA